MRLYRKCLLFLVLFLCGCSLFEITSNQTLMINDTKVNFPISVNQLNSTLQLNIPDEYLQTTLQSGSAYAYDTESFGIIALNQDDTKEVSFENADIIGVFQNLSHIQHGAKAILFFESLYVGLETTSGNIVSELENAIDETNIKVIYDRNTRNETIIAGKREIRLTTDWKYLMGEISFPIQIRLENGVISEIRMITNSK